MAKDTSGGHKSDKCPHSWLGNKRDENILPHEELTFLESFLEEVGLELYPEGRGVLIGREQTTSEGK